MKMENFTKIKYGIASEKFNVISNSEIRNPINLKKWKEPDQQILVQ